MGTLFFLLHAIVKKADRIISRKNEEIDNYNRTLEQSQMRIKESINEVIEHGSFHVRFQGTDLLKCWDVNKCKHTKCPSHNSDNLRCWQVAGTFCEGKVQGVFAQKFGDCRKCDVYRHAMGNKVGMIGENFNNMMTLLQNKHAELENANIKLNELVDIDPLTQIGNRRSFQKRIESTHLLSLRHNHPYSVLICDVDKFKKFNDTYGHQKGDYILISIANKIKASMRKSDEVFRWGGEEFVVILPEQNIHTAIKVAENLRAEVQSLGMELAGSEWKVVTVSIGVACIFSDEVKAVSWEKVLKKADDALYRAKAEGRNRVCASIMAEKESPSGT
jgi:diguanylate cyclase (GGDEF)-like protein